MQGDSGSWVVAQACEGLCYQRRDLAFLNMLNIEKIACSDLSKLCYYYDFAILFHMVMENWTLGLFMAGPKSV